MTSIYDLLLLPDHPTPLSLRTHTSEPVPYLLYKKGAAFPSEAESYDESQAAQSGILIQEGYTLMDYFIKK